MSAASIAVRLIVIASVAWSFPSGPVRAQASAAFDHATLARQALKHHIQPGYAAFLARAEALGVALGNDCAMQAASRRPAVTQAFENLMTSWARIEHIRFGPVTHENRLERIFFWPDRRGLGGRQVAQTLRTRDPDATDPTKLAGKRVAIQGLAALETLLFDPPAQHADDRRFRCAYAKAIAANVAHMARQILAEWQDSGGYVHYWLNPGEGNPHFIKPSETTLALAKALDNGLERVRDEWIGAPLGLGVQRRRLTPVLSKSGRTLAFFEAGLDALHGLYALAGMRAAITATANAHPQVTVRLNADLVAREIAAARGRVRELLKTGKPFDADAMMGPLIEVGAPLRNARLQLTALLGLTAGISMGFNATDGD